MSVSSACIARPVATSLITLAIFLLGVLSFYLLPIASLPQVDFPTISVNASLPGASAETMAATIATPLENILGNIAGVNEITSRSSLGSSNITLQFDLDRSINGAARDVQAAIYAARTLLPSSLPNNPSYRKVNPADAPMVILALTSNTLSRAQMYDAASTLLVQSLSQIKGVGQVMIGGGALPAVRLQLNPHQLTQKGIALQDINRVVNQFNAHMPKGVIEQGAQRWSIAANDQMYQAKDYENLILSHKNGADLRLKDVGQALDSVQDVRNYGLANQKPAILLFIFKEAGANVIQTVDNVRQALPTLQSWIGSGIHVSVLSDRTPSIRNSLHEVEYALLIAMILVIAVVGLFLKNWRMSLLPAVAIPVSLAGTFALMYVCGYSLNNLSMMALTIATGFIADDTIVVIENITRHLEKGYTPQRAARKGTQEITFTIVSITVGLLAVFIPLLWMGGIIGRLFREFAVILSCAVTLSMLISLTTTPMMASVLLQAHPRSFNQGIYRTQKRSYVSSILQIAKSMHKNIQRRLTRAYRHSLIWILRHRLVGLAILLAVIALNVYPYQNIHKNFFPQQDVGAISGSLQADQSSSFQSMKKRLDAAVAIILADPAVATMSASSSNGQANSANFYITLKPLKERNTLAQAVIERLRPKLAHIAGSNIFLTPVQDIRIGGRPSSAQYQYAIQADSIANLQAWEPKIRATLARLPELIDVNTDQQNRGIQTLLTFDRDAIARAGLQMQTIQQTLNNAFGQRQIGIIYQAANQYRVVMELEDTYLQNPDILKQLHVINASGQAVPLGSFMQLSTSFVPLSINHQNAAPAVTISFNLANNTSLSQASQAIDKAMLALHLPNTVSARFQGSASMFQQSLASQPMLILAAIVTLYLVLGMLYESLIHPISILSTLPSAGVGALLALMLFNTDFSMMAFIGVILLIGIVKKNAIMMIDFAIKYQRKQSSGASRAIFYAACLRFRPIFMTTLAAIMGAIPLALSTGEGAELRQPLGIAIVGGLILSQWLTLYTTPVVFVYMEKLARRKAR